jgi:L-aminopeptidase/D-esterase-like protein
MPGCEAYWAWPHEWENEFGGARPPAGWQMPPEDWGQAKANPAPRENTTLAIIATDATLTPSQTQRLSQMATAGLARSIRPVFAPFDGDVVFALSTAIRPMPAPEAFTLARLGELAASALARAVALAVHHAQAQDEAGL